MGIPVRVICALIALWHGSPSGWCQYDLLEDSSKVISVPDTTQWTDELLYDVGQSTALDTVEQQGTTGSGRDGSVKEEADGSMDAQGEFIGPNEKRSNGRLEIGSVFGSMPYAIPTGSAWNGYMRGDVSMDVLGVPLGMHFDLGTDLPIRGQRNSVRFSFDPPKAVERERWADAKELHRLKVGADSLEKERSRFLRKIKGNEARLAALRHHTAIGSHDLSGMDSLTGDPLLSVPAADTMGGGDELTAPTLQGNGGGRSAMIDSMEQVLSRDRRSLEEIDGMVKEQRMQLDRVTAVMNASKQPGGLMTRLARGIKRLEVGTCSPASSEFLINGVNFQGISFEYAHKDLFIAFDRGRSFDDTWMDADPVSRNVRLLQQNLFLIDAQDLNPRRLTAVRAGFGTKEGSYVHVGYLYGTREDLPLGVVSPTGSGPTIRNHVAEIDAGYAVRKGHGLRFVYARSLVTTPGSIEENSEHSIARGLFSTGSGDQAVKLGWSSMFERTRTRAEVEVRSISPWFQSFGMGFIRNGSRGAEARLDQPIGKKLRLRGRYAVEERFMPGSNAEKAMSLERAHLMASYRPIKAMTLRVGHMPVRTRMSLSDVTVESANDSWTVGGDLRKRWRRIVAIASMDGACYSWRSSNGLRQDVVNLTAGISLQESERWHARLSYTSMSGTSDSLFAPVSNLGLQAGFRTRKSTTVDAAIHLPSEWPMGWMCAVSRPLGKRVVLRAIGERYSRSDVYFSTERMVDQLTDYTWTLSATYAW